MGRIATVDGGGVWSSSSKEEDWKLYKTSKPVDVTMETSVRRPGQLIHGRTHRVVGSA